MAKQFITLCDCVSVRADEIAGVYVDRSDCLTFTIRDGDIYQAGTGYGIGVFAARQNLLRQTKEALMVSRTGYTDEFKSHLQTLSAGERFEELKQALGSACNSFTR